jgi:hypothetical protein
MKLLSLPHSKHVGSGGKCSQEYLEEIYGDVLTSLQPRLAIERTARQERRDSELSKGVRRRRTKNGGYNTISPEHGHWYRDISPGDQLALLRFGEDIGSKAEVLHGSAKDGMRRFNARRTCKHGASLTHADYDFAAVRGDSFTCGLADWLRFSSSMLKSRGLRARWAEREQYLIALGHFTSTIMKRWRMWTRKQINIRRALHDLDQLIRHHLLRLAFERLMQWLDRMRWIDAVRHYERNLKRKVCDQFFSSLRLPCANVHDTALPLFNIRYLRFKFVTFCRPFEVSQSLQLKKGNDGIYFATSLPGEFCITFSICGTCGQLDAFMLGSSSYV